MGSGVSNLRVVPPGHVCLISWGWQTVSTSLMALRREWLPPLWGGSIIASE